MSRICNAVRLAHAAGSVPTRLRPLRLSFATRPPLHETPDQVENVLFSHADPVHEESFGTLWLGAGAWRRPHESHNLPQ